MNEDALFFFSGHEAAIPIYEKLENRILAAIPDVTVNVSKTQISFSHKRGFAFVSFNPYRRAKERPEVWMTVSFGLRYQKQSPRIDVATEPYPNRWTHHVMVGSVDEIDDELMAWLIEAAAFSASKK